METINKILPENTIPTNSGRTGKVLTLGVISFLLQALSWYTLARAVADSSALNWIWAIILSALAISLTSFFLLTNKRRVYSDILIVLSAAVYFLIFPHNLYVWIGGLVFALFSFWYEYRLIGEAKSRLDFSVTRVLGASVSILIYGILILLGLNIYNKIAADFKSNPDKYYERIGQQAAKSVPYFTKVLPSNVDPNQPLGDYLTQQAQNNPQYSNANTFQRQVLVNEAKTAFQNQFQVSASDDESLSGIMARIVVSKIRGLVEPYQNYLPIIFTIIVIGVLYTFAFLIRWVILFISWILFRVLLFAGFFKLTKVQVLVEKLEI